MCRKVWSWRRQQWWGEVVPTFLSAVWHWEVFHGVGVQDIAEFILTDALFLLDGGGRREGKKERERNLCGGGVFPLSGPTFLAVLWIAVVRCN
jgi:hypothetical protein